jgi:hypothetical protein
MTCFDGMAVDTLFSGKGRRFTPSSIAAPGRRKDVRPCMLVEDLAVPANPDFWAHPFEREDGEVEPATILVPGELPDGDWPF